jgi:hypothetical protein
MLPDSLAPLLSYGTSGHVQESDTSAHSAVTLRNVREKLYPEKSCINRSKKRYVVRLRHLNVIS